jgi:GT2 family glycosyltransferase
MSRVSLVILTYNRARELLRTVRNALRLPEAPPVIVVDNGSHDGTASLLATHYPQVQLVPLQSNLGAAARNLGVERATTPYVAFSDDDTCWAPGSLARAAELLDAYPGIAGLSARVLIGEEQREDPTCAEMARSPLTRGGMPGPLLLGFLAGASVFRRQAFSAAGGYEPRLFLGGEETLLAYDLASSGWSLIYAAELTVHHFPSALRDPGARKRLLARNAIWVTWLRRPFGVAFSRTLQFLCTHPQLAIEALKGLPWALRRRKVLAPEVEKLCRRLEQVTRHGAGPSAIAPPRSARRVRPAS